MACALTKVQYDCCKNIYHFILSSPQRPLLSGGRIHIMPNSVFVYAARSHNYNCNLIWVQTVICTRTQRKIYESRRTVGIKSTSLSNPFLVKLVLYQHDSTVIPVKPQSPVERYTSILFFYSHAHHYAFQCNMILRARRHICSLQRDSLKLNVPVSYNWV